MTGNLTKPLINDTSFVTNSHSRFIGLNSTFEDEDAVFNAIVNSKLHHVKQRRDKTPSKSPERVIAKNMHTIPDEESVKDVHGEESKSVTALPQEEKVPIVTK